MAIVRREVSDRTPLGKFIKWVFILFNALMGWLTIRSCSAAGEGFSNAHTEAEMAGTGLGVAIVGGALIFVWLAGAVILGLFVLLTRRKKIIESDE